jgi:hypothetical protein
VRRFALAIVVAVLSVSASGLSALVLIEPCSAYEQSSRPDQDCAPTCVTCGCCAQAVEPVALAVTTTPEILSVRIAVARTDSPKTLSRDILHVPKSLLV